MEDHDGESIKSLEHSSVLSYLINEVYRPYIVKKVVVKHLLSEMPFMRQIMPIVFDEKDHFKAANIFLDHLKNVDELGKYQMFKEALGKVGYQNIVDTLENEDISDDEHYVKLMELFKSNIEETIEPSIMAESVFAEGLITLSQLQEVKNLERNKSQMDATFLLLDSIPRLKKEWFEIFLNILDKHNHRELVKKLDDKYYTMKEVTPEVSINPVNPAQCNVSSVYNHEAGDGAAVNTKHLSPLPCEQQLATSCEIGMFQKELLSLKMLIENQQQLLLKIDSKVERLERMLAELIGPKNEKSSS